MGEDGRWGEIVATKLPAEEAFFFYLGKIAHDRIIIAPFPLLPALKNLASFAAGNFIAILPQHLSYPYNLTPTLPFGKYMSYSFYTPILVDTNNSSEKWN